MNLQKYAKQKKMEDAAQGFVNCWRIVCDGKVIYEMPARLGEDFAKRMCGYFLDYIKSALTDSGWVFKGCGGEMTAKQWLAFQEKNLGMPLSLNVKMVKPGRRLPLCPSLDEISKQSKLVSR